MALTLPYRGARNARLEVVEDRCEPLADAAAFRKLAHNEYWLAVTPDGWWAIGAGAELLDLKMFLRTIDSVPHQPRVALLAWVESRTHLRKKMWKFSVQSRNFIGCGAIFPPTDCQISTKISGIEKPHSYQISERISGMFSIG